MSFLEGIGLALGIAMVLLIALFARRLAISRGGTVDMSIRLSRRQTGRGWALGMARFSGDQLIWYRLFSLWPRPRRTLNRADLVVVGRRNPTEIERRALMTGSVVVECLAGGDILELAMDTATLTGLLSWLEAAQRGRAA